MAVGMFNPGQVRFGEATGVMPNRTANAPFLPTKPVARPQQPAVGPFSQTVAPESVRATQGGPFDQAYRQNIATFAGGDFMRPGGSRTFDPTANAGAPNSLFGDLGGGGPTDLLSQALAGGGLRFNPPEQASSATKKPPQRNPLQWWGNQFNRNGRMMQ